MDFGTRLMWTMVLGSIGLGYFVYGKKQHLIVPMLAGAGLCIYPYFVSGLAGTIVIALVLIVVPWLIRW